MTCEVCGQTAAEKSHPCRFEKACKCWYGTACNEPSKYEGRRFAGNGVVVNNKPGIN